MEVRLGTRVRCADDVGGEVVDVVIDPATRRLTHLVVKAPDKLVRLVPADLVVETGERRRGILLTCTSDELHAFEPIREFAYVRFDEYPANDEETDVGVQDMVAMPAYGPSEFGEYTGDLDEGVSLTYDRIPKGEAELRVSSGVLSADGHRIGHVTGFILDDGEATHLLLRHGHLWGKRNVTVPMAAVDAIETDSVTLTLEKDVVGALPSVRAHHRLFS